MEKNFISVQRANILEEGCNWLTNYIGSEDSNIEHIVGNSINDEDKEMTELLIELGKINKRKKEIIDIFRNKVG